MSETSLDKSLATALNGHGTISIRVVVLEKGMASSAAGKTNEAPIDAAPDELLPDTDKRPTSTFLEEPKRGRQCCVFLINGQRQHAWDNQFIIRDLELKYLRNRMIVVVDCDGLKPEAIANLMQGSRHQFFEGNVYFDLESRVLLTLKGDPDLRRLEEEAEDDISSLEAGDEAVKAALDQLIEAHHEAASHISVGENQPGGDQPSGPTSEDHTQEVVVQDQSNVGVSASAPILAMRPELATIRLRPNDWRRFLIYPKPESAWKTLENMTITFDPPVKELQVTRTTQLVGEEVALKFVEPDDFEEDEYPIETTVRSTAMFKDAPELRLLERRVIVNRRKQHQPKPPTPLEDDPTYLKVTSRQPIKIVLGGPDVHVKLRWNGKDELVTGDPPKWNFRVACESPSVEPLFFLTRPVEGRFELLIQAAPGLNPGEQIKFDIEAIGPGKSLPTAFLADVVEAPSARKISSKVSSGAQRRPPYDLRYVKRENWGDETCWGQAWTSNDSGSFDEPTLKTPLTIFINQDMDLLNSYRDSLISRKMAETTIQQRINRYTAHVAFHLYQMYRKKKETESAAEESPEAPSDEQMRDEIQRVARTLLKLMEVSQ